MYVSTYQNFVYDFPGRCAYILKQHYAYARQEGFEVTLMLSMASTGFIVPFERLKDPQGLPHPSGDRDKEQFKKAKKAYDKLCQKNFIGSKLWRGQSHDSWFSGSVSNVTLEPEYWPELENLSPLNPKEKVSRVLNHLRNALAHGNIFTKPSIHNEIGQIIFLKEVLKRDMKGNLLRDEKGNHVRNNFDYLLCSPSDFLTFLMAWFDFLKALNMPRDIIPESSTYSTDHEQIATA